MKFLVGGKGTSISVLHVSLSCKIFCIAVEVYEAHAKTCTFLECLLVPYLCVFYCDVVELGSYGNLKYYDTMTEEGKKYFRIIRISIFRSLTLSVFSVFCLFVFSCFQFVRYGMTPFCMTSLAVWSVMALFSGFYFQHFSFATFR